MHAIKAIYDGTNFNSVQPIPVKESYEVIITFIEPVKKGSVRPPFEYESMSGKIWTSDDFDAPLDDFKDYME
jgi:hypothetical protein